MNVSAIIVTRGDVDVLTVLDSLPEEWEKIVWDNRGFCQVRRPTEVFSEYATGSPDIAVYGRYAAIDYASHDIIYVQDDDVIVSEPSQVVEGLVLERRVHSFPGYGGPFEVTGMVIDPKPVVCNMPAEFRHDFYIDHALVGFGAAFHRDAPRKAFESWERAVAMRGGALEGEVTLHEHSRNGWLFYRTCDIIFTALTPRVLVDVPKTNLPYAEAENRMYRQPEHQAERSQMLRLALKVKENQ